MGLKNTVRKRLLLHEALIQVGQINIDESNLNEILNGYLAAAFFTEEEALQAEYDEKMDYEESEFDDEPEDEVDMAIKTNLRQAQPSTSIGMDDLEHDSKIQAYLDIKTFLMTAGLAAVEEAVNENGFDKLGMDIWFTRNRHGSGFFDHHYDNEAILTNAAQQLKEVELYLTDNNTLVFSNA